MTTSAILKAMEEADRDDVELDRKGVGYGWARISLGNVIVLATAILGFLYTVQQTKTDLGYANDSLKELKTNVQDIQKVQGNEGLSLKGISDTLNNHDLRLQAHDNRFDGIETRLKADETTINTLSTNQQLVDQALQMQSKQEMQISRQRK